MIKYIGSKRTLLPQILSAIQSFGSEVKSVADVFSGTARVGHCLKGAGYQVVSNDVNAYAHTLATCYVEVDREDVEREASLLLSEFNGYQGSPGYFTETFCEKARFFQPKNGAKVDAIREAIEAKGLPPDLRAVMLTSLMEAADRVDSTTGLQMAYLKTWAPRAHKDLELRFPDVLPQAVNGKGRAQQGDALKDLGALTADLAYLDPPYNQHSYLGNYHVWESLVLWDKPEVYGVACKRVDVKDRTSPFNSKRKALSALQTTLSQLQSKFLVVSFSDEGYISRDDMVHLLSTRGAVEVLEHDFKRYVGAQIGIHSPEGTKVGTVSHTRNKEYLFLVR